MRSLVPCSSCKRHVEAESTVCPFCATSLTPRPDPHPCQGPCSGHAFPRLSRGAMAAIGATLLCASCLPSGSVEYGLPPIDRTGGQTGTDSGQTGGAGGQIDGGVGGEGGAGGQHNGGAGK